MNGDKALDNVVETCLSEDYVLQDNINGVKVCAYAKRMASCQYQDEKITSYNDKMYHLCKATKEKVVKLE
jgi:hypothetical protein